MSAATGTVETPRARPLEALGDWARRNAWTLSLLGFLAVLLVFTRLIQPTYGVAGIQGLAISVLPLALAAAAQAVVVIAGGIDLSIAAIMALTSVVAAVLMKDQPGEVGLVVFFAVLLLGLLIGAINGSLVVITRVPDIVVTLAMSFVWAGVTLLVLRAPGGGASDWLTDIVSGSILSEWVPRAAVVLVLVVAAIWLPIRRSRLGLSMYAIGSDQLAAFRSGVSVGRTKIQAYAIMGLFSALGGLSLTANTGIGTPVPGPVHAAQRRRDRARWGQPGRRPGRHLRPDRRRRHPPAHPHRHDLPQRQHQPGHRPPGRHPHRRGHGRQPHPDPPEPGMTDALHPGQPQARWTTVAAWRRLFTERPIIPLLGLLAILVIVSELARPGHRQRQLGWDDRAHRGPAGDHRRLPDADDADRRHRPVGRRGRIDGRVPGRDPGRRTRACPWPSSSP